MYQRYAISWLENRGHIDSDNGSVALRRWCLHSGHGVFARLKSESGVHRVQRVPETEASGRIHTPLRQLRLADLRTSYRIRPEISASILWGGGAGVRRNKTDSAVRKTHLPTASSCFGRKDAASEPQAGHAGLRSRVYELERQRWRGARRTAQGKSAQAIVRADSHI